MNTVLACRCAKRLYREIHARELATPFDKGTQAVLDAETRVGEVDRDRVSGKGEREAE